MPMAATEPSVVGKGINDESDFHSTCFACGAENLSGLHLRFEPTRNGVTAVAKIHEKYQSYSGVVHGGVVAAMLDAAMVHCLRRQSGHNPFTCRLDIRYRRHTPVSESLVITATIEKRRLAMGWVKAEIQWKGQTCVEASGVFKLE